MGSVLEARVLARTFRDQRRRATLDLRRALKNWREELRYRWALKAWLRAEASMKHDAPTAIKRRSRQGRRALYRPSEAAK
jgi:hypothetical protein